MYENPNIADLLRRRAFDEALPLLQKELEGHPDNLVALHNLSVVWAQMGYRERAVEVLLTLLQRDPGNSLALTNLAWEEFQIGRKEDAIHHSAQLLFPGACEDTKVLAQGHNNLGYFYYHMAHYERAVYHYAEALRIDPNNRHATENLANLKEIDDPDHGILRYVIDEQGHERINFWYYREAYENMPSQQIILTAGLIETGRSVSEGQLVEAVTIPWLCILRELQFDPYLLYRIPWRKMEELIAATYQRYGWDEVILTPASGDKGRDIIASKKGFGAVRIFDQVKAYAPSRRVTADDVRALLGVLSLDGNVSKGILTTTAEFAPGISHEFSGVIPYRIELRNGIELRKWLVDASRKYDSPIIGSELLA